MNFKLALLAIVSLLNLGCIQSTEIQEKSSKPNIIFILADDMGYGDAGFNGQKKIMTPVLDQMAKDGAVFSSFYAASPVCGPSRASLFTGLHQGHCPIRGNPRWTTSGKPIDLTAQDNSLAKELQKAGYATGAFGKWGLNENMEIGTGHPLKQGFDEFWGFNTHIEAHYHWPHYVWHNYKKVDLGGEKNWLEKRTYVDDLFTDKAIEFIDKNSKNPFFIYLSFTVPHRGITAPEKAQLQYRNKGWPKKKGKVGHYRNDEDMNVSYAAMISQMDACIGRVRAELKKRGLDENTLILFSSDNGHEYDSLKEEFFDSNGPLTGMKRFLHEGGIRVPTVAVWPSTIKPSSTIDTPLAFWDLMPTFCEMANTEVSSETDGISFLPAMQGKEQTEHEYLYWEFNEKKGPMQAVRFGKWKAYRSWDNKKKALNPLELYDLSKDISEKNNLASKYPEIVKKAATYLKEARTENKEFPLTKRQQGPKR